MDVIQDHEDELARLARELAAKPSALSSTRRFETFGGVAVSFGKPAASTRRPVVAPAPAPRPARVEAIPPTRRHVRPMKSAASVLTLRRFALLGAGAALLCGGVIGVGALLDGSGPAASASVAAGATAVTADVTYDPHRQAFAVRDAFGDERLIAAHDVSRVIDDGGEIVALVLWDASEPVRVPRAVYDEMPARLRVAMDRDAAAD
jgi:hypothetical protein